MTHAQAPRGTRTAFTSSLLVAALLVVPFIVLQLVSRWRFQEGFPYVLFTFMGVHSLLIAISLVPALQCLRRERSLKALKPGHWAGLLLAGFLGYLYINLVLDQLPCFLGVPNCD